MDVFTDVKTEILDRETKSNLSVKQNNPKQNKTNKKNECKDEGRDFLFRFRGILEMTWSVAEATRIHPPSSSTLTKRCKFDKKSIYRGCDLQTETQRNDSLVPRLCWGFRFNIFYDPFDSFHYLIIHNMKRNNLLIYPTQRDTTALWSLAPFLSKKGAFNRFALTINRKLVFLCSPQYIIMILPTVHHFLKSQRTPYPRELIIFASVLKYEPTLISN